jgi:predicted phosphodiesterase
MPKAKTKARILAEATLTVKQRDKRKIKAAILAATKKPIALLDLARRIDAPMGLIDECVAELQADHHSLLLRDGALVVAPPSAGQVSHYHKLFKGGTMKVGVISDNQLGNQASRLDVLRTAYDHYKAEGIEAVYHAGNMIDGYSRFNMHELIREAGISLESQTNYARLVYPKMPGIVTYFITGDCHEGWYMRENGINVGAYMESRFRLPLSCTKRLAGLDKAACHKYIRGGVCHKHGREDLKYVGHIEADITLFPIHSGAGTVLRLMHPGGGTAYAHSYKAQKYVESLSSGEKPAITVQGHYHKAGMFMDRDVYVFMAGTTESQSIFMRKHQIVAHVGYWILEIKVDTKGVVSSVRSEFMRFYDEGYYRTWEHSGTR